MRVSITFIPLIAALLVGACSSGNSDPLASNGDSSLGGGSLANAEVVEDSILPFYMFMVNTLIDDYYTGVSAINNFDGTDKTVNTVGSFSGNLLVTAIQGDTSSLNIPDVNIEFKNYSNTGRFFYAGHIKYTTSFIISAGKTIMNQLYLHGNLTFAGDYAGSIKFITTMVSLESNGEPVDLVARAENPRRSLFIDDGLVTIESGSTRKTFNPNGYADHPPIID